MNVQDIPEVCLNMCVKSQLGPHIASLDNRADLTEIV